MLLVRVFTAAVKPALLGGALCAAGAGAYFVFHNNSAQTPFEAVHQEGHRVLISEFGDRSDTIVAVDPDNPDDRRDIATIDHAPGYGVFPVLSPDGDAIAYTALPANAREPSPDTPALSAIVDTGGNIQTLADDVDLLVPPVWDPDGSAIVIRKSTPEENSAGSFELLLLGRDGSRSTITTWATAAIFPIAFSPDGSMLYFAALNNTGSDLYAVAPDGRDERKIAHLTDEVARDWRLSPDGSLMAYSVAESGPTPAIVTRTLDLATGVASDAIRDEGDDRAELNPTWRADGELTIALVQSNGGGSAVSIDPSGVAHNVATSSTSIDLPLEWSPDGAKLAVRAMQGANMNSAGASHLEVVDEAGRRQRLSDQADVLIVGWLP